MNLVFPTGNHSCHWQSPAPVLYPLTPIYHLLRKGWAERRRRTISAFQQVLGSGKVWFLEDIKKGMWTIWKHVSILWAKILPTPCMQVQSASFIVVPLLHFKLKTKQFLGLAVCSCQIACSFFHIVQACKRQSSPSESAYLYLWQPVWPPCTNIPTT